MRDYSGRTVITLLLETKTYSFLQVKVIESAIRSYWLGKTSYAGAFMARSTAYQMLFLRSMSKSLDSEYLSRREVFSFNRTFVWGKDSKKHSLSYHGIFSRMYVIYMAELYIFFLVLVIYHERIISLYSGFSEILPVLFSWFYA